MVPSIQVALVQCYPRLGDKAGNLEAMCTALRRAASAGAQLVLFPEMSLTGYLLQPSQLALAEAADGPSLSALGELCAELDVACVVSFPERNGDQFHIAASFIDRDGHTAGHYRKTHLYPGVDNLFAPGQQLRAFDTSFGRVGLLICYDLEFPEVARTLKLDGAQFLLVATANMSPFEQQQTCYLRARAAENDLPIAICNRVGKEGDTCFFGASAIAQASGGYAELPLAMETLRVLPLYLEPPPCDYLSHRRPELYRNLPVEPPADA